jgi:hypothetical protein
MTILYVAMLGFVAFLAACYYIPIFIVRRRFAIRSPKERADVEDAYRKTTAQVLGGAAIVFTFAWTWTKDNETLNQTKLQATNQQFTEAIKLIKEGGPDSKTGAIHSLEFVYVARNEYYVPILRTLRAYIYGHKPADVIAGAAPTRVTSDIDAALYTLGRMTNKEPPLNLVDAYLVGATFAGLPGLEGADLRSAILYAGNFAWAQLKSVKFHNAKFADSESFGSGFPEKFKIAAEWETERFNFIANFDNASLAGAVFCNSSMTGASFKEADLANAKFVNLNISRTNFKDAKNISSATFAHVCFEGDAAKPEGLPDNILASARRTCEAPVKPPPANPNFSDDECGSGKLK